MENVAPVATISNSSSTGDGKWPPVENEVCVDAFETHVTFSPAIQR